MSRHIETGAQGKCSISVEHNRVFEQAARLVKSEIPLHERQYMPEPGWWARRKLQRALSLFARALELQPGNWSAMWWVGMIHKRFRDYSTALLWFERAFQVSSYQPDVAREACSCALELGHHEAAISFADRAVQVKPDDAGLRSNLALALLIGGRVAEAKAEIEQATAQNPSDQIILGVRRTIEYFVVSKEKPPSTQAVGLTNDGAGAPREGNGAAVSKQTLSGHRR